MNAAPDETNGEDNGGVFGDGGDDGVLAYFEGVFELFSFGGIDVVVVVLVAFEDGGVRAQNALRR